MKSEQTIKNKHINKNRLRSTRRKMDCRVGKIGSQQYRNDGKQTCGYYAVQFSLVQLLNCARLFVTPWIAAYQASLSITSSQNLLKFMPIELVMPSNHLILCHPLLLLTSIFPSIRSFPVSHLFTSGGQSTGASAQHQSFQ